MRGYQAGPSGIQERDCSPLHRQGSFAGVGGFLGQVFFSLWLFQ
jgi:hypothetical protein